MVLLADYIRRWAGLSEYIHIRSISKITSEDSLLCVFFSKFLWEYNQVYTRADRENGSSVKKSILSSFSRNIATELNWFFITSDRKAKLILVMIALYVIQLRPRKNGFVWLMYRPWPISLDGVLRGHFPSSLPEECFTFLNISGKISIHKDYVRVKW
jgi:hypothetical protein